MMLCLTLLAFGGLWAVLPLALVGPARRWGLPPVTAALTLVAAAAAAALVILMPLLPSAIMTQMPDQDAYQDVFYIIARNRHVITYSLALLAIGGLALMLSGLLRSGPALLLLAAGHWGLHIGAGVLIVQMLPVFPMPHRYVDYPDTLFWMNLLGTAGAAMSFVGMAALLLSWPADMLARARKA